MSMRAGAEVKRMNEKDLLIYWKRYLRGLGQREGKTQLAKEQGVKFPWAKIIFSNSRNAYWNSADLLFSRARILNLALS